MGFKCLKGLEGIHHEPHGLFHQVVSVVGFSTFLLILELFQFRLSFLLSVAPLTLPSQLSLLPMPMDHLGLAESPRMAASSNHSDRSSSGGALGKASSQHLDSSWLLVELTSHAWSPQ